MSLRSLYERRFRRRDNRGKEPLLDSVGSPCLVVVKGELIGVRATDGSVIPVRGRRAGDVPEPDEEWVWNGRAWRNRFI